MRIVNVHEAKTHLSRLIQEVVAGGEVVIARANKPLVRLVLLESARDVRRLGTARGLVEMTPDFDEPIEDFRDYR